MSEDITKPTSDQIRLMWKFEQLNAAHFRGKIGTDDFVDRVSELISHMESWPPDDLDYLDGSWAEYSAVVDYVMDLQSDHKRWRADTERAGKAAASDAVRRWMVQVGRGLSEPELGTDGAESMDENTAFWVAKEWLRARSGK